MSEITIYCIGNPSIPGDTLALELVETLKVPGFSLQKAFSPEELFNESAPALYILDVAMGIKKIEVLTDLSKLKHRKLLSLHDFDLQYFLHLMEKMGSLPQVTIIALPLDMSLEEAKAELPTVLTSLEN